MSLSANDIRNAIDRKVKEIEVPEWGGSVFLKTMTTGEAIAFHKDIEGDKPQAVPFLKYSLCDKKGNRLFTDDIDLEAKNPTVIARLFEAALELQKGDEQENEQVRKN